MSLASMLAEARSHLGYVEDAGNRTPFGAWFGLDASPWCDEFASYCAHHSGNADVVGRFAYTPSHVAWFKARGAYDKNPRPGDLVFFRWGNSPRVCHVGIVESIRPDGRLVTIEGNSQPGEVGDQSNGGGVYRRVRARTYVDGYGHPAYPPEPVAHTMAAPTGAGEAPRVVVDGEWGPATTHRLQQVLNAQARAGLAVDGEFGFATVTATQRLLGVGADGVWGTASKRALQRRLNVRADGVVGAVTVRALQVRLNGGSL